MADPVTEQQMPQVEEAPEAGVKPITTPDVPEVPDMMIFDDIDDSIDETTEGKHEIVRENSMSQVETGECSTNVGEVVEEEIMELKIGKVKPKLATYSMHCPNCKFQITKVILRWKMFLYGFVEHEPVVALQPDPDHVQVCKYDTGNLEPEEPQQQESVYVNRRSVRNYHQAQAPKYVTETTSVTKG